MKKTTKKLIKGVIVSDKMDKTVVVKVERVKSHPIYKKKFTVSKNIKAHDEKNEFATGDVVEIEMVRPISRDKKFSVVNKVK
ncbi:MAG: 30S ribosomal protein S17 [Candidatus Berkelbacteria bacterium]